MDTQNQIENVNRLHNRHLAKLLTKLHEINTAEIIIEAVKIQLSYYTTDIKNQVLLSEQGNYEKRDNKR